jgi:hypothetical protein
MVFRHEELSRNGPLFKHMTGLTLVAFAALMVDLRPALVRADIARLSRPGRKRAIGAGNRFALSDADQAVLACIFLRHYYTQEALGALFGVSDSAALRSLNRVLPVLEKAGLDTMRMPDPGTRKGLPEGGQAVLVDTFEQRTHRPKRRQRAYYSGKKKAHTLKSQVAVDEDSGRICHAAASVVGRRHDGRVYDGSGLKGRVPKGVEVIGDSAYIGKKLGYGRGAVTAPRRKPRGQERPAEDRAYNRALSRRRVKVEHAIGRMRRYRALSHVNRHSRDGHTGRVRAVAGLVNRMLGQPPSE